MTPWRLRAAARAVRRGGVIAYPTEAVYGLGCDPLDAVAVFELLELKGRPVGKGLILIAADFAHLRPFVDEVGPAAMAAVHASWPGPHTWLLPARAATPPWLSGDFDTLAVRVTAHPVAA
ncbi:MAG TPA: Sua5/YciO/YrdC/YwlC family protein, partial [Gammaproteobacteria bacterium]